MSNTAELEFQQVYDTYWPRILRYLVRMVGPGEAEDVAQDVFVKAAGALGNFRGEAQLSTWLYRIATNTALDRLRSPSFQRASEMPLLEDSEEALYSGEKKTAVEREFMRQEMCDCVRSYIDRLPDGYRTALLLSEWEGLRNDEIAEILEVPLSTVKIRLHRGRQKLMQALSANCDPSWIEENEFLPDLRGALPGS